MLGVPRALVVQYAIQEDVTLGFTSVEWHEERIRDVLGAGVTSDAGGFDVLSFGGETTLLDKAVSFEHRMAAGGTLIIDLWKAQGSGELALNFNDDIHEIPYNFRALVATTGWDDTALGENQNLFRMRLRLS
jgi:hypothetical protein